MFAFTANNNIHKSANILLSIKCSLSRSLIQNGGKGTKPSNKFIVIIPLLAIKLNTILVGNLTNNFVKGRNIALSMCKVTLIDTPIIFHYPHPYNWQSF